MQPRVSVIYSEDHAGRRSEFPSLIAAHFYLVNESPCIIYSRGDGSCPLPYLEEIQTRRSINVWEIINGSVKEFAVIKPNSKEATA